jgi:hypothetical protein
MGADIIWRQGEARLTADQLADTRILPGTPLESLLRRFRTEASAQPSRVSLSPPEREIESISSDDDEEVLEEISGRRR